MATFAFAWQTQLTYGVVDRGNVGLLEKYTHVARHHKSAESWAENVDRAVDTAIRAVARAAVRIQHGIARISKSLRFAGGSREYSNDYLFDD